MGHLMAATARHPSERLSAFQCGFALWRLMRAFRHYNAKKYFVTQQPKSDVEMAQGVLRRGSEERGSDNEGGAAETLDHNLLRAYWR